MESNFFARLVELDACKPALNWVESQPDQSPAKLWATCHQGDWMAWYLGELGGSSHHGSPEHRRAVLVACLCARTATPHAGKWATEISALLGCIEAWAHGEAVDLIPVRYRLRQIRHNARGAAYKSACAASAAAYYAASIYAPADAVAFYAAGAVDDVGTEANERHLADIADLIRAAIPEAP